MQDFSWLLAQVDQSRSWLNLIDGGNIIPIVIFGAPMVVIVIALVFSLINKIHRRNAELAFKREMLDRGLSVDEIERILAAKSNDGQK